MRIALFWNRALLLPGAIALASCGNDNLPKPQKLGPLRVLGLIANTPEVNDTNALVQITPIVSDFTAASSSPRNLNYSWKVCLDPGIAAGITPACTGNLIDSDTGTITTFEAPLTQTPFSGTAANDLVSFNIPANTLVPFSATQATNGVAILFTYELTAGSETTSAFRRIIVTSRASLNSNVSITSIGGLSGAGTPGSSFPASETDLTPTLGSTADTYTVISSTGETLTRTEKLTVSWFTTDGEFEFSRSDGTNSNKWTPPSSGTPLGLAILRDDRGGMSAPFRIGF